LGSDINSQFNSVQLLFRR